MKSSSFISKVKQFLKTGRSSSEDQASKCGGTQRYAVPPVFWQVVRRTTTNMGASEASFCYFIHLSVCLAVRFTVSARRVDQITCGVLINTDIFCISTGYILGCYPISATLQNAGLNRFFMQKIHMRINKSPSVYEEKEVTSICERFGIKI